ncbi:MAG: type I restriction endonuclease, partial [Aeromonas sp.]
MSHIFTEAKLEQAIIDLLGQHQNSAGEPCYPHYVGTDVARKDNSEVLIAADLRAFLARQYQADGITDGEMATILHQLQSLPASDLYQSNKTFCQWLSNGFLLKREDRHKKDLYIELVDTQQLHEQLTRLFAGEVFDPQLGNNRFRLVNQLDIEGKS